MPPDVLEVVVELVVEVVEAEDNHARLVTATASLCRVTADRGPAPISMGSATDVSTTLAAAQHCQKPPLRHHMSV